MNEYLNLLTKPQASLLGVALGLLLALTLHFIDMRKSNGTKKK